MFQMGKSLLCFKWVELLKKNKYNANIELKENTVMKIKEGFVLRDICGEYVIVPVGEMALQFNGLLTVNEVGASLWKLLNEDITFDKLLEEILNEYDVNEEIAKADIQEFINYLNYHKILE